MLFMFRLCLCSSDLAETCSLSQGRSRSISPGNIWRKTSNLMSCVCSCTASLLFKKRQYLWRRHKTQKRAASFWTPPPHLHLPPFYKWNVWENILLEELSCMPSSVCDPQWCVLPVVGWGVCTGGSRVVYCESGSFNTALPLFFCSFLLKRCSPGSHRWVWAALRLFLQRSLCQSIYRWDYSAIQREDYSCPS